MIYQDKVVVVTGSGEGIGRSIALNYASEGAKVVVVDINERTGRETVDLIYDAKGRAIFLQADVTNEKEVMLFMENTIHCYNSIDILVNNVGMQYHKKMSDLSVDEWERIISINLKSAFLCSREALRYMKVINRGHIINVASSKTFLSTEGAEAYAASKGGLISMTKSMASSLKGTAIHVNCISPGQIQMTNYERLAVMEQVTTCSLQLDHVEDVAKACLYITKANSSYVNGSNIVIDNSLVRKVVYLT